MLLVLEKHRNSEVENLFNKWFSSKLMVQVTEERMARKAWGEMICWR